jgi:STE24 endopeptidase
MGISDEPPAEVGVCGEKGLDEVGEVLTAEQLAESKEYGRRELWCAVADVCIDVLYLAVMALAGARVLDLALRQWGCMHTPIVRLMALYLVTLAVHLAVSFPLSFHAGFVLEHRYRLSRQSVGRWLRRYALRNLLVMLFGLLLAVGLFAMIWWTGPWWWLVAALASFVVTVVMGQLVPIFILPLFYKIEKLDNDELMARFQRLASGTSLKLEGVYRMRLSTETAKANALLAGLGRTRRVILGDTLLDGFEPDEIEVVLAHEIGHHVHHHISKLIVLGLACSVVSFFVSDRVLVAWVTAAEGTFDYAQTPVWALPMLLLVMTVSSMLLGPVRNGISRRFERTCDEYALRVTGNVEAFRSAFKRLAKVNKADPSPHPLEVALFHDHPPIASRLALARTDVPREAH